MLAERRDHNAGGRSGAAGQAARAPPQPAAVRREPNLFPRHTRVPAHATQLSTLTASACRLFFLRATSSSARLASSAASRSARHAIRLSGAAGSPSPSSAALPPPAPLAPSAAATAAPRPPSPGTVTNPSTSPPDAPPSGLVAGTAPPASSPKSMPAACAALLWPQSRYCRVASRCQTRVCVGECDVVSI